eukprot:jgi/Chrzof1/14034/Cz08g22020.t1
MSAAAKQRTDKTLKDLRNLPDNKRCFNCESLGTTYYVPQFSMFVCTQCSGIHMQFGQRVKSVTLAEFKSDEIQAMKDGGNEVAAYKYLAKYTPEKDLRKPTDKNPQRCKQWIQTVFVEKRFYDAAAYTPRRQSQDSSYSTSISRRASRESGHGSASTPIPVREPPVRDLKDVLGDNAVKLRVGPKEPSSDFASEPASPSTSPAPKPPLPSTPAVSLLDMDAPVPAAPAVPAAAPDTFDPFAAAPPAPAMPAANAVVPAASTAVFDPFAVVTAPAAPATPTPSAHAAAPSATSEWASFDSPTVAGVAGTGAATHAPQAGQASNNNWASFGADGDVFGQPAVPEASAFHQNSATPGGTGSYHPAAHAAPMTPPAFASFAQPHPAQMPGPGATATSGASPGSAPTSKPGTPRELPTDLFADVGFGQAGAFGGPPAGMAGMHPGAMGMQTQMGMPGMPGQVGLLPGGQQQQYGAYSPMPSYGHMGQGQAGFAGPSGYGAQSGMPGSMNPAMMTGMYGGMMQQGTFGGQQPTGVPAQPPGGYAGPQPGGFGTGQQPGGFGAGQQPGGYTFQQPTGFGAGQQPSGFGAGQQPSGFGAPQQGMFPGSGGQPRPGMQPQPGVLGTSQAVGNGLLGAGSTQPAGFAGMGGGSAGGPSWSLQPTQKAAGKPADDAFGDLVGDFRKALPKAEAAPAVPQGPPMGHGHAVNGMQWQGFAGQQFAGMPGFGEQPLQSPVQQGGESGNPFA